MIKKILNTSFLIFIFTFVFLILKYYLSEKNIIFTNKSRSSYSVKINENINNLPVLKNDTDNIIFYNDDLEKFKNKRKKRFWEELISNLNE